MTPFEENLNRASGRLRKAESALGVINTLVNAGNIEAAYQAAFIFAHECEQLTLQARLLPAYTGNPRYHDDMALDTTTNVPIRIGFTIQGWFGVHLPALLPKKEKGSPDYLRAPLYRALGEFIQNVQTDMPVRTGSCVIVFRHRYDRTRPERRARDHDNIEVNVIVDVIALFLLHDDSPLLCDHHYCTVMGDRDETEIYIIPREEFPQWWHVANSETGRKLKLRENPPELVKKPM